MENRFVEVFHITPDEYNLNICIVAWNDLIKTTYRYGFKNSNESFFDRDNRAYIHHNLISILLKHSIENVIVDCSGKYGLSLCEMIEGFKIEGITLSSYMSKVDYIKQI